MQEGGYGFRYDFLKKVFDINNLEKRTVNLLSYVIFTIYANSRINDMMKILKITTKKCKDKEPYVNPGTTCHRSRAGYGHLCSRDLHGSCNAEIYS